MTNTTSTRNKRVIIRFLTINDVYELDNLPRFATAVRETRAAARKEEGEGDVVIKVLAVVAGDFLAPSLLSCLDDGRGMTDVLSACDIDYVCLGNHETDIPHRAMLERVAESNFVWINSSMPALPLLDVPLDATKLPDHAVIEAGDTRVALLGLLTDDPSLYRPNSFGSAAILPLIPTAERLREKLYQTGNVDCVLAMTHQSIAMDRILARKRLFPLILGGHDHEPYIETYAKGGREGEREEGQQDGGSYCRIPWSAASLEEEEGGRAGLSARSTLVKVGMDAKCFGFVDVAFLQEEGEWEEEGEGEGEEEREGEGGPSKRRRRKRLLSPEVTVKTREAITFEPDATVNARVAVHLRVLEELERAKLCRVPTGMPLSSKGVRKMQTSVGSMLLTAARKALQVDCCFVNGGNIRAGVAYPITQKHFSYKDLKAEIPFSCNMVTLRVPGAVLSSLLQFSRRFSLLDPPVEKGGFLQVDNGVHTDPSSHAITHIMHQPLDPSKTYSMATTWGVISGIDDLRPILDYIKDHPEMDFPSSPDCGRGLKEVLVAYHSRTLWWNLAKQIGFKAMDTNGDGVLCRKEVEAATRDYFGEALSQLVLGNLMATADYDGDGVVSVSEFVRICLSHEEAFLDGDLDGDGSLSFDEVWIMLKSHFDGKSGGSRSPIRGAGRDQGLTEGEVRRIFEEIDVDGEGGISWAEFREHLTQQREHGSIVI